MTSPLTPGCEIVGVARGMLQRCFTLFSSAQPSFLGWEPLPRGWTGEGLAEGLHPLTTEHAPPQAEGGSQAVGCL